MRTPIIGTMNKQPQQDQHAVALEPGQRQRERIAAAARPPPGRRPSGGSGIMLKTREHHVEQDRVAEVDRTSHALHHARHERHDA